MNKILLFFNLVLVFIWSSFYFFQMVRDFSRPIIGSQNIGLIINTLIIFIILFPVLLTLLFLPPHYFTRFWNFAVWGLPLTLGAVIFVNLYFESGYMGLGAGVGLLLIGACYVFFFLGVLIQLIRAWWLGR